MLPLLIVAGLLAGQEPPADDEFVVLRGLVISPATDAAELANRASVAAALDFAYECGFNVVFPVAWNEGVPLWQSVVAERTCGVNVDPRFADPKFKSRNVLTEIVVEAHRVGIEAVPIIDLVMACGSASGSGKPVTPDDSASPGGVGNDGTKDGAKDGATKDGSKGDARPKDGSSNEAPKAAGVSSTDLLDPKAQAFALELIAELVHIHEVDGLAFDARGLRQQQKLDEKGIAALGDWIQTVRAAVDKVDPSIRFVLLDGGTAQSAWMQRGLFDLAMPRIAARDIGAWKKRVDALAAEPWVAADTTRLAPLFLVEDGDWRAGAELVTAAIEHDRSVRVRGEVLSSLALLKAGENELGDALQTGPYYGVARLPWRQGVAWRTHTDAIPPKAGEGSWEWRTDSSGVLVLELGGKQKGDASWTLRAHEKGSYDLFVWIAPDSDVGKRVVFATSRSGTGLPPRVVDPTLPRNKGWVYMGTVPMNRREEREVLRLQADETDPTKVTVAGPMVAILSRRARR